MDKKGNSNDLNAQYIQQIYQNILATSGGAVSTATKGQSKGGSVKAGQSKSSTGQQKISSILNQAKAQAKQQEDPQSSISTVGRQKIVTISQSHGRIVKGLTVENLLQAASASGSGHVTQQPVPSKIPAALPIKSVPPVAKLVPAATTDPPLTIVSPSKSIFKKKSSSDGGPIRNRLLSSPRHQPYNIESKNYYKKWKRLKKSIKSTVFMNAAVCDEVVREEEKLACVKEERRFLLRKLLHFQSLTENQSGSTKTLSSSLLKSPPDETPAVTKVKAKKKVLVPNVEKKKPVKDLINAAKTKPKKSRSGASNKHVVPPIPLDPLGRPIFPINLGDLTIHSVGEIASDRTGFHTSNSIFPIGYCSTRIYCGIQNPETQCLYTCKITDIGSGPSFEIVPEDNSDVFKSRFLSECHSMLLRKINQTRGMDLVDTAGKGPDFFGLSHPVVQNLIQSCPGAKKCNGYKWIRFEVNKALTTESMASVSEDPTVSFHAFKAKLFGGRDKNLTTNLRSLLTGALNGSGAAQPKHK